jgi:hypothetical protein
MSDASNCYKCDDCGVWHDYADGCPRDNDEIEDDGFITYDVRTEPGSVNLAPGSPPIQEFDPNGIDAHVAGAKLDAGKPRPGLVLAGFALALARVTDVGTYGAGKYSDNGWMEVPDGFERYTDAMLRHWLKEAYEMNDPDTEIQHAAHLAWNALARLELLLRD